MAGIELCDCNEGMVKWRKVIFLTEQLTLARPLGF